MLGYCRAAGFLASLSFSCFVSTAAFCASIEVPGGSMPPSQEFAKPAAGSAESRLLSAYGSLPLIFEPNRGQSDPAVQFLARGPGYRMLLTPGSAIITLRESAPFAGSGTDRDTRTIQMRFVGANTAPDLSGDTPLPGASNYFNNGDPSAHIVDVPHFAKVKHSSVYPGIDLVYYGNQRKLEYDFVLAPGADPGRIKLEFDGIEEVRIDADGDLVLRTSHGEVKQHRPTIYQEIEGVRAPVDGAYVQLSERQVGFRVAAYDPAQPLIIDPVLSYSTFLGGSNSSDVGTAIAVDSAGNAYVTGWTYSSNFPLVNAYDSRIGASDMDVFVSKLNSTGSALIYSTYLGGSKSSDYATGIAIDSSGSAYVTGSADGAGFPVSTTAYQKAPSSGGGAFVAKLGPTGNTLVYATYLLNASNTRIAVDSLSNSYITGQASIGFATTAGAFQTTLNSLSGRAPFALKLNPTGSAAVYSTFVGGTGTDKAQAMALDVNGNVYLGGSTTSTDFPVVNAYQPVPGGGIDGFVSKLNASGSALIYSTYLGGTLDDSVNAIAVDQSGNAYLAGETYSSNFPVKNAFQPVKAGRRLINSSLGSGFVTKLMPSGSALAYSSFLGGEDCIYLCEIADMFGRPAPQPQWPGDAAYGIAVDTQGHAYVTGLTKAFTFPLADSRLANSSQDGHNSLFVTKVSLGGTTLVYSSIVYTGYDSQGPNVIGAPSDAGQAIAVDASGNAYLTKEGPTDFPTTTGALQATSTGLDAIVFKLSSGTASMTMSTSANPAVSGQAITLTANVAGAAANSNVIFYDGPNQLGGATVTNGTAAITATLDTGIHVLSAVYRNANSEADAPPITQIVNPSLACN